MFDSFFSSLIVILTHLYQVLTHYGKNREIMWLTTSTLDKSKGPWWEYSPGLVLVYYKPAIPGQDCMVAQVKCWGVFCQSLRQQKPRPQTNHRNKFLCVIDRYWVITTRNTLQGAWAICRSQWEHALRSRVFMRQVFIQDANTVIHQC